MNPQLRKIFYWSARVLGIFMVTAVARMHLQAVDFNLPFGQALVSLFSHLWLTLILVIALVIAWRWEIVGAIIYGLIAGYFTLDIRSDSELIYYLLFVVPYAIVAMLFLISGLMKPTTPKGEKGGAA